MSLFGNKLATAQGQITGLVALIASTGFKIDAEAATLPTAEAFQAHLNGLSAAAVGEAVKVKAGELAGAKAEITAMRAGFEAAGVKLGEFGAADFAAKEGETLAPAASAVKTALETAITQRATRQIAAAGHPSAIDVPPGDNGSGAATAEDVVPATAAEFLATHKAIKDPHKKSAYFRKHEGKFSVR